MFDHPKFAEAVDQVRRLNDNLEALHRDAEELKPLKSDLRLLISKLEGLQTGLVNVGRAAKQIAILNQILLQIKKVSGWSGVLKSVLDGFARAVSPPPRK